MLVDLSIINTRFCQSERSKPHNLISFFPLFICLLFFLSCLSSSLVLLFSLVFLSSLDFLSSFVYLSIYLLIFSFFVSCLSFSLLLTFFFFVVNQKLDVYYMHDKKRRAISRFSKIDFIDPTFCQSEHSRPHSLTLKAKRPPMQTYKTHNLEEREQKIYTTIPLCAHPFRPFHAHNTNPQAIHTLAAMAQNAGA